MPGGNGVMETPLQARVLDEAAEWLMRLHDSGATDADRAACRILKKINRLSAVYFMLLHQR